MEGVHRQRGFSLLVIVEGCGLGGPVEVEGGVWGLEQQRQR